MRCGRDRQEFGETLDDAQDHRLQKRHRDTIATGSSVDLVTSR
jgi:hypothetical protein